jgi:gamma-glutamylcyclotransferase (GGCT)/AIG2-like uncharacterized protein YtfP
VLYPELAEVLHRAPMRLAVYGTLAPGECNHHQLTGLAGEWSKGTVRGDRDEHGWGMTHGFPGLRWNPQGGEWRVQVFESADLPSHWARLDEFEGSDYRRVLIPVEQDGRLIVANIYLCD